MATSVDTIEATEIQLPGMNPGQIEKIDHNHPLFIHPSDTQGAVLISI